MKFYIDTCIWRDYFENRYDKYRALGKWALEFLNNAIEHRDKILYSDIVIKELQISYSPKEIDNILSPFRKENILEKVSPSKKQIILARNINKKYKIGFCDALHAVLAKENNAALISRDKHFHKLENEINLFKPEDLL